MENVNIQPLYKQLKDAIIKNIRSGKFQVGACLPSERSLEKIFNVSRISVRKALKELVEDKIIRKSHGKRSIIENFPSLQAKNMAFVTTLSKQSLLDIYRLFYETLLLKCNSASIKLYYLDIGKPLPLFVDCVIFDAVFISGNVDKIDTFKSIINKDTKLIALDKIFEHEQFVTVCTSNQKGGQDAALHLISRGCKNLLFLGVDPAYQYRPFRERKTGFIKAAQEKHVKYNILDIETDTPECVEKSLRAFIEKNNTDGVFAFNDHLAINTLKALQAIGKSIPEEVAVIGFDGLAIGDFMTPSLTTISQPIEAITQKALDISMSDTSECLYEISGKLIKKEST